MEGTDGAIGDRLFGLGRFEHATAQNLVDREIALLALKRLIRLAHFAAALRTTHFQRPEIAGDRVALKLLGLPDDRLRHPADLVHELLALELAALDLPQLEFPIAGEFRRDQFRKLQSAQQRDQRKSFRRRDQFAAMTQQIFFVEQAFDDRSGAWEKMSASERGRVLWRVADLLEKNI